MMVESILSLALSVHSNKGVYALFLGSGASRPAGIPTGWEIVLDLIRKLAHLRGEQCEPDPAAWYVRTFGETPEYDKLLAAVAGSPAERSQLLRGYLEPTPEERDRGMKMPTLAHRAIAHLVAGGYIRIVVTTNFDRLLEHALESVGVTPTVISTADAVAGALPLTHTKCAIVKVHGDYLDTRIRNTPAELAHYDESVNRFLDRIFDEFGLIICGWSAEWDVALRAALERCSSHRFTTYWTSRESPSDIAQKLISLRRAQVVSIRDTDSFFSELLEKVKALKDLTERHPLSAKVAVATIKNYLVDDRNKIRLHDLMKEETERLYVEIGPKNFPVQGIPFSDDELLRRLRRYESLTEILTAATITGCYYGEEKYDGLWAVCLERIANVPRRDGGLVVWLDLRLYPALILLYAGGIASVAAGYYRTLATLLTGVRIKEDGRDTPAMVSLSTWNVMEEQFQQRLARRRTLLSDHLYVMLRDPLREFLPADEDYDAVFDRFEYLFALVYADLTEGKGYDVAVGRFGWKHDFGQRELMEHIRVEATAAGVSWPPLQAGLFEGTLGRFLHVKGIVDDRVSKLGWY